MKRYYYKNKYKSARGNQTNYEFALYVIDSRVLTRLTVLSSNLNFTDLNK